MEVKGGASSGLHIWLYKNVNPGNSFARNNVAVGIDGSSYLCHHIGSNRGLHGFMVE